MQEKKKKCEIKTHNYISLIYFEVELKQPSINNVTFHFLLHNFSIQWKRMVTEAITISNISFSESHRLPQTFGGDHLY